MAKVKVRDNQTGQIIEVDEKDLGQYGLSASPAPQAQPQTQVQTQPAQSSNILLDFLSPFIKTGKTIGGAGYEVLRGDSGLV